MNWITRWKKIGIKVKQIFKKQPIGYQDTPWKSCPQCKKISYSPDLVENFYICECNFHFDLPPKERLGNLFDSNYEIIDAPENINPDPLNFEVKEKYKYSDKIKKYREITSQKTALMCATGNISGLSAVVVCFNPKFGGGRFGPAENEHFLKASNFAIKEKVDVWIVIYQSSGIDVHSGVTGLAGMTKSVIAMDQIKKAKIPTFAVAARAVAGGTYASSFFQHEFIIIESKSVENLLFSGKRVTANILKGTDQMPELFGTASGVMNCGLADIILENRNNLKETIVKLSNIVLKKTELKTNNVDEAYENPEDFKKTSSTTS
ncbi:MAG: acetyl-CoA carboxylase carboxyl transferase subunit beta [Pelagibacterales bacterium]|nr:acetyl-CoA carboxylase carboxyl transferase subunit beta [Pelagibacterales bacterium]